MSKLTGKVVVVTGAGRGIGLAYADFIAAEGAKVVVNDTGGDITGNGTSGLADEVANAIVSRGGIAVSDSHDVVTDADSIIGRAVDEFGRIDGLVNNAGIVVVGGIDEVSREEIDRIIGIHVLGAINTVRAAWPIMKNQGAGRIINTSSAAVFGAGNAPLYPTTKASLIGLTKALAIDGAPHGIKVNAVLPLAYSRMAEAQAGFAEFMLENFPPQLIAPFVGALLTDETPCSGELFAVGGGRAARVFLSTVAGAGGLLTVDDVLGNFEKVMSTDNAAAPLTMEEEIGYEYSQLGFDLANLGSALDQIGTPRT